MKLILGIPIWLLAFVLRLVLMFFGLFGVLFSLLGKGAYHTPWMWRWCATIEYEEERSKDWTRTYKWYFFAIRNPLEGMDGLIKQPVPEVRPNPDVNVRFENWPSDSRFMQHGIFWEYWYLRKLKSGKFFEFRIGWKFVDGNKDFVPTFQLGPKK